jgi:hypothetical protein
MAAGPQTEQSPLPEPPEQVHLPEPSYLPVVTGFGITLMLVGVVLTWIITIIGALVFLPVVVIWIRSARADISELPLEHR